MTQSGGASEFQIVVAIDGPVQSGKSTVARKVAKKLHFVHLNSGLLYRAVGSEAVQRGISLDDEQALVKLARSLEFSYTLTPEGSTVFALNSVNAEARLTGMEMGELASRVAVHARLREVLSEVQREIGKKFPLVLEGRDATTVVFPETRYKYYLDASLDARVGRRLRSAQERGEVMSEEALQAIRAEILKRDERDMTRAASPVKKAHDAVVIDTSHLSVEEVVNKVVELFQAQSKSDADHS